MLRRTFSSQRFGWGLRCLMAALALIANSVYAQPSEEGFGPSHSYERPMPRPCPVTLGQIARCFGGRDPSGAYYLIAIPNHHNGMLLVHAHGGPRYFPPSPEGSDADLERFSVMVRAGYSWVGSTYRAAGYGVRQAAEDVDVSRRIYWNEFGRPKRTFLHGQSYGANIAAKLAEQSAVDAVGRRIYDGVLLTSGAIGDRIDTYEKQVDLLSVYQYYCEDPFIFQEAGLVQDPKLSSFAAVDWPRLEVRIQHCTGAGLPENSRSTEQLRRLAGILGVTGGTSRGLVDRIGLAQKRLHDIIANFLSGENPFDTSDHYYSGSVDDAALNAEIRRFTGSRRARDELFYDYKLSGILLSPTIMLNAKQDPVVAFETSAAYLAAAEKMGREHLLLRLASLEDEHSTLARSGLLAILNALVSWVESGTRPTPMQVVDLCQDYARKTFSDCRLEKKNSHSTRAN